MKSIVKKLSKVRDIFEFKVKISKERESINI
jgi:hypothetical protein